MRNLLLILHKYHKFFIFLLLEIICLSVFVRNNNYQFQSYLHSARGVSGAVYKKKKGWTNYINLSEKNKKLQAENALLKSKLGTPLANNPLKDTSFSRLVAADSIRQTIHYKYVPARVLNNSFDKKNNFITLNLGSKNGIKKNMSVVGSKGIVGKITHVSTNYSLAASVLSNEFGVSAVTPKNTLSKVAWESLRSPYHAVLTGIPESEKLKKGDTILTSGFSQFPQQVMIGRVIGKLKGGTTGGGRYKIRLSTDFRKLDFVYIIKDETTMERTMLEDSAKIVETNNE